MRLSAGRIVDSLSCSLAQPHISPRRPANRALATFFPISGSVLPGVATREGTFVIGKSFVSPLKMSGNKPFLQISESLVGPASIDFIRIPKLFFCLRCEPLNNRHNLFPWEEAKRLSGSPSFWTPPTTSRHSMSRNSGWTV